VSTFLNMLRQLSEGSVRERIIADQLNDAASHWLNGDKDRAMIALTTAGFFAERELQDPTPSKED
jgi:hypothetical protein